MSALHRHQLDATNVSAVVDRCSHDGSDTECESSSGGNDLNVDEPGSSEPVHCSRQKVLQRSAALFLMGLKEKHKL